MLLHTTHYTLHTNTVVKSSCRSSFRKGLFFFLFEDFRYNFVLGVAFMALCLSKTYPLAIGLQPWLGNSGIGKGGFFRLCVKNTGCRIALLYGA
jgi:hypothetical protein